MHGTASSRTHLFTPTGAFEDSLFRAPQSPQQNRSSIVIDSSRKSSHLSPASSLYNRGRFHAGLLVPPVETRQVTRVPCLAEPRSAQIPVGADFLRRGAQVVPKIDDRWTSPEPVAVIDAVNHEARLEYERMRDHRIVLGVGVLLDIEILLNRSLGVRKEGPLGSDRCSKLLKSVVIVGRDRGDLSVRDRDLRIERGKFQMLLVFLWAVVAARERQDQWIVAL